MCPVDTPFEHIGEFWLPDRASNRIGGTITYSPGERPKLRLAGSFRERKEDVQALGSLAPPRPVPFILGKVAGVGRITLYRCRETPATVDLEHDARETWIEAFAVLIGVHCATKEELQVHEFSARLSHLDEWADMFALDRNRTKYNPTTRTQRIVYQRPEPINGELLDGWRFRAGLEISGPSVAVPQRGINVVTKTCIVLTSPSPCPFEEMIEKADIVSSFISLAVQQPVYVTDLWVRPHIHESVEPVVADPVDVVYYTPAPASPARLLTPPHDMLFVLADVRGHLSTHLQCWERSWHSMLPILSLYFSRLYEQRIQLEHRFLSLIQAVEGYHRRRLSKLEAPEEEHAARIKDILAAVPERHKTWLRGQLRHSNEPRLDKRLSELSKKWDTIMRKVARNRRWVQEAVTIRNNLAHQKEDAEHFSVDQVLTICERLKLLLDLWLLTEAGFGAAEIRRLVYRYWRRHPPFLAIDAKRMVW